MEWSDLGMHTLRALAPKIWFDRLGTQHRKGSECDCDPGIPDARLELGQLSLQPMHSGAYRQVPSLHRQACDDEHWLLCNPLGTGHLAVLNRTALALLDLFQTPRTIASVAQAADQRVGAGIAALLSQYVQLGFIEALDRAAPQRHWAEPRTLIAWLHTTNACNLRCPYCYLHKTTEDMAQDTAYRAVDAVFRSALRHGFAAVKLKFAGGEASLQIGMVLAVYDYAAALAQQHGIALEAVILSNGVALSQRAIHELAARQIKVMISLDGVGAYHDVQRPFANGRGSFGHIQRTLGRLLSSGLIPDISITVSDRNLEGLPTLMEYVLERDLPFSLNYYRENECAAGLADLRYSQERMIAGMRAAFAVIERNLPRRSLLGCLVDRANLSAPHRYTCGVGHNYLVIDQDGGVAKCQMEIGRKVTTINAEDVLQGIREDRQGIQNLPVEEKEGCRTCEWRQWCAGGCAFLTYRATGRYDVKSPNCNIYKALYPDVLRLEALRLLKHETPWEPANIVCVPA
jgi:uncharacterized protein